MSNEWKNGMCGCFNDCGLCILTAIFPCHTTGKNAEATGKSCCIFGFLSCLEPLGCVIRTMVRQDIRNKFNIKGDIMGDLCMHIFCPFCGLMQEAQEVRTNTDAVAMSR